MKLSAKERRAFSWARAFGEAATHQGLRDGLEYEVLAEAAKVGGRDFSPHSFVMPWALLGRRDMTSAGVSGSSHLVATDNLAAADSLRPFSVTLNAGVTLLQEQRANAAIPRVSGDATGYWLASELDGITPSAPTLGQVALTPKHLGAIVVASHQFRAQADSVDAVLEAHLLKTIGRALDRGVLGGSGTNGEPMGLINSPVLTEVGTSLGWSNACNMLQRIGDAGVRDEDIAWIGTPSIREILSQRERAPGNGLVWDGRSVGGFPAHATPDAPSAALFVGPWREVVVALWGDGPAVEVDHATYLRSGKLQLRVLIQADVGVRQPGAFAVATSIT